ncbi:ER membrane protein complex subunit 7 [Dinochytrium kinnereticum]|nr:ER membrane protein complex subunit 7 [Dinochytrium kinnereticum]
MVRGSWALAFIAALILPLSTLATKVSGRLAPSEALPDLSLLPATTKVLLNGGASYAFVEDDGSFTIDVPDGSHLLEIISPGYFFNKVRLSVSGSSVLAFMHVDGTSWVRTGPAMELPLELPCRGQFQYFMAREGFDIWSIFANPMMLMMGGSLIMFFVLPKMMSGLDPETLKEMQQRQKEQKKVELPDISQNLANWLAPSPAASSKK